MGVWKGPRRHASSSSSPNPNLRFSFLSVLYTAAIIHRHCSLLLSHSLHPSSMASHRHPRPPEQQPPPRDRVHVAAHHPLPLSTHPSPAMSNGHHPAPLQPPPPNVNVLQTPQHITPLQRLAKANEVIFPFLFSLSFFSLIDYLRKHGFSLVR